MITEHPCPPVPKSLARTISPHPYGRDMKHREGELPGPDLVGGERDCVCVGSWEPTMASMCRSFLRRKEAITAGQQERGHCGFVTWALQGTLGSPGKEGT